MTPKTRRIITGTIYFILLAAQAGVMYWITTMPNTSNSLLWEFFSFITVPTLIFLFRYIAKQIDYSSRFWFIVFKYVLPIILSVNTAACIVNIFVKFVK